MIRSLLRSGPVRIALAFAIAVVVTTYSVFAFVYWKIQTADKAQISANLQYEAAEAARYSEERIKSALDLRLMDDLRRLDYVALFDASGKLLYGNVTTGIPVPVDGRPHDVSTLLRPSDGAGPIIAVARRRPDGGVLLLGRSLVEVYRLEAIMRWAFLTAVLPTILLALAAGVLVSRSASHRLSSIQHAIRRVMQGKLDVRLPVRRKTDDINELVVAVNQMLDEIVRLMNQIRSVGDNIAHDLKTPLAVMRARLERGLDSPSQEVLRTATQQAISDLDKALTTVTALLRISELESGLRRSAFATMDLVEICHDVYDLFEPLAAAKDIAMGLDLPSSHMMLGDGDLLREVLANLIDNAIKFTPQGGRIVVQCGAEDALLRVSDSGPGVPAEEREKIFKRFYRAKATNGAPGVGLGLSMAATIVALHGYILRVADTETGATFEVVSPSEARTSHVPVDA